MCVSTAVAEWLLDSFGPDSSAFLVRLGALTPEQQTAIEARLRSDLCKDFTLKPVGEGWELRLVSPKVTKQGFQSRFNHLRKKAGLPFQSRSHGQIVEMPLAAYVHGGVSESLRKRAKECLMPPALAIRKNRSEYECRYLIRKIRWSMVRETCGFCFKAWRENRSDPLPAVTRKRRAAKKLAGILNKMTEKRLGQAMDRLIAPARQARKAKIQALARQNPDYFGPAPKVICMPPRQPFREDRFSD